MKKKNNILVSVHCDFHWYKKYIPSLTSFILQDFDTDSEKSGTKVTLGIFQEYM